MRGFSILILLGLALSVSANPLRALMSKFMEEKGKENAEAELPPLPLLKSGDDPSTEGASSGGMFSGVRRVFAKMITENGKNTEDIPLPILAKEEGEMPPPPSKDILNVVKEKGFFHSI